MHRIQDCPFESYHLTLSDDSCDGPETWERMQRQEAAQLMLAQAGQETYNRIESVIKSDGITNQTQIGHFGALQLIRHELGDKG